MATTLAAADPPPSEELLRSILERLGGESTRLSTECPPSNIPTVSEMKEPEPMEEQLRLFVRERLHHEVPFMKQNRVDKVAQLCKDLVREHIEAAGPQMEESKKNAGLLKLPREIRNRIFLPVLLADQSKESDINGRAIIKPMGFAEDEDELHARSNAIHASSHTAHEYRRDIQYPGHVEYPASTKWVVQPPLTRVSKEIRAETLPVYYGANKFRAYVFPTEDVLTPKPTGFVWLDYTKNWLLAIGPKNASLIKNFEVRRNASVVVSWYSTVLCSHRISPYAVRVDLSEGSMFRPQCLQYKNPHDEMRRMENLRQAEKWAALEVAGRDLLSMGLGDFEDCEAAGMHDDFDDW